MSNFAQTVVANDLRLCSQAGVVTEDGNVRVRPVPSMCRRGLNLGSPKPRLRKKHACKTGLEGIVSKRWIAFPLRAIPGLAEVQDSGSAGGEARGGCGLGLLTITTRERRGLR